MRVLVLAIAVAGCSSDPPTLDVGLGSGTLAISLERDPSHDFGTLRASVNGVDCGSAAISPGSEGIAWSEASSPATASWQIDLAEVGASAHVEVTEDGDAFSVDVPVLAAPRAAHIDTPLDAPITPGSTIVADDGVPSDSVSGGFEIDGSDGSSCTTQAGTTLLPGEVALELDLDLADSWFCGDAPARGTVVHATLSLELWGSAELANCHGVDLTCNGVALPDLPLTTPIAIQF